MMGKYGDKMKLLSAKEITKIEESKYVINEIANGSLLYLYIIETNL